MALTMELEPEVERRLARAAGIRGVDAIEYARNLIEKNLPDAEDIATLELFASWEAEDATDDPAELEARCAEWEELRASLEANPVSLRSPAV